MYFGIGRSDRFISLPRGTLSRHQPEPGAWSQSDNDMAYAERYERDSMAAPGAKEAWHASRRLGRLLGVQACRGRDEQDVFGIDRRYGLRRLERTGDMG